MIWTLHKPIQIDQLGIIPMMLSEADERPAREQLNEGYAHGGGWRPMEGWKHTAVMYCVQYPGDPVYAPVATASLWDEVIAVYNHAWVAIFQRDGSFEISRMD